MGQGWAALKKHHFNHTGWTSRNNRPSQTEGKASKQAPRNGEKPPKYAWVRGAASSNVGNRGGAAKTCSIH